ncbi:MAG: exodeoxyribonuclease V subunit gamma [Deltaproteobacteria bacterium]|nr:exodeoxyribonuclease V subunit gamma [Deltaproteobacteria bacterium]
MMEEKKEKLLAAIKAVDEKIDEQEKRIPPHSVKPVHIAVMDELESLRDELVKRLAELDKAGANA